MTGSGPLTTTGRERVVSVREDHSPAGEGSHSVLKVRPEAESREAQRLLVNFLRVHL